MTETGSAVNLDRSRTVQRLRELVSVESPSLNRDASRTITDLLRNWLREVGAKVRAIDSASGVHLLAEVPGEGDTSIAKAPPLLLLGHSDTVWPIGTLSARVPWDVHNDIVRGPGVYDMKGGLLVMISALSTLSRCAHRPIRVFISCDEEVGSPSARRMLRSAIDGVDGVIGFEPPHPDGAFKSGRRGSTRVQVDVQGIAAHAALDPDGGVSAIDELVDQILEVRNIVNDPMLPSRVLCNIGTVSGGTRANVIAAEAHAEIGLRFQDTITEQRVLEQLQSLRSLRPRAAVSTRMLSHRPAWLANEADNALLSLVQRAGNVVGQNIQAGPAAGAGDTNFTGALGVASLDGFGPLGGGAHAESEHILLHTLFERAELLAEVLKEPTANIIDSEGSHLN